MSSEQSFPTQPGRTIKRGLLGAAVGIILVMPILYGVAGIGTGYTTHIMLVALIWCLLAAALNLLVGYTGPESFAHGALFGIGGFTAAIATTNAGLPMSASIFVGAIVAMIAASVISLPSLRLKGIYFAILTIAFQIIYEDAILIFDQYTGGLNGLSGIPSISDDFGSANMYIDYYAVALLVLFSIFVIHRIAHSGMGDTFRMIRQDEQLARHLGYNTTQYKLASFSISAFFTGLAGALFAQHNAFMGPTLSDIFISFQIFVFVIVGGAGYFWGPIIAAGGLTAAFEVLTMAREYTRVLTALLLLVVIIAFPEGLAGINYNTLSKKVRDIISRVTRRSE